MIPTLRIVGDTLKDLTIGISIASDQISYYLNNITDCRKIHKRWSTDMLSSSLPYPHTPTNAGGAPNAA